MTISKIIVTLDSADDAGALFTRGSVRILLNARTPVPGGSGPLLEVAPARAQFDGHGAPVVSLYPNDLLTAPNDDSSPGTQYRIFYDGCPGNPQPWSFYVLSTNGGAQLLSGLASAPVALPGQMYLPVPSGTPQPGDVPVYAGNGTLVWQSNFLLLEGE